MATEPKITQDPSSDQSKVKVQIEFAGGGGKPAGKTIPNARPEDKAELPKTDALPQQLSSQAQQVEAARQLQTARGQAKAETQSDQAEEEQDQNLGAQQAVMPPAMVGDSTRRDIDRLKQQREQEYKKAQAKFKGFEWEKKKREITAKYKLKAGQKAEKYKKLAKEKTEQMVADGIVTVLQEIGPLILQLVAWVCLLFLDACSLVSWIGDGLIAIIDFFLRGISQYRRIKKVMGLGGESEDSTGKMIESFAEKFMVQTVLPVGGGAILSMIPILEIVPWEMVGVALSFLLILADLVRSYLKLKSAEQEARKMAS